MRLGDWFVYGLSAWQVTACAAYVFQGENKRAGFWLCLATANFIFAGIK
jgi:hypothetical protein